MSQLEALGEDTLEDATEPMEIVERATSKVVAKLKVKLLENILSITYETLDPRITSDNISEAVNGPVLLTFTSNSYKGKAKTVRLIDESDELVAEYPYPWDDKPNLWPHGKR